MARKPTLLCVDDDAQCLSVRKIMFEAFGFSVTTSVDPRQGMRMHSAKRFDAVVVDFQMPHMNGAELAKSMKMARPDVPVVILSGLAYLPENAPQYHDRFFCKTESGFKLAQEILNLIADSANKNGKSGQVKLSRRVFAAAGIALGFASQGVSDMRHRIFRRILMPRSASSVSF